MRLLLLALALVSVMAWAYSKNVYENPKGYANTASRAFAAGDSKDTSGWRECVELEPDGATHGLVCEGKRTILVHGGQMVDVNYFCEFQFTKEDTFRYRLEYELCQ